MILQKQKFVGPLLPLRCGERLPEYTSKVKMLGFFFIDCRLTWNSHIDHATKQLSGHLQALKIMRFLPTRLLEEICFKTDSKSDFLYRSMGKLLSIYVK